MFATCLIILFIFFRFFSFSVLFRLLLFGLWAPAFSLFSPFPHLATLPLTHERLVRYSPSVQFEPWIMLRINSFCTHVHCPLPSFHVVLNSFLCSYLEHVRNFKILLIITGSLAFFDFLFIKSAFLNYLFYFLTNFNQFLIYLNRFWFPLFTCTIYLLETVEFSRYLVPLIFFRSSRQMCALHFHNRRLSPFAFNFPFALLFFPSSSKRI